MTLCPSSHRSFGARSDVMANNKLCGFCGRPGKITKEHVVGRWVGALLGAGDGGRFARNALEVLARLPQVVWDTDTFDQQVRMACKLCNEGWMARLEEQVRPIVSPMMLEGRRSLLTPLEQAVVSTWAAKTAMVSEFLDPTRQYFTADERRSLMEGNRPPLGSHVWLGYYEASSYRGIQAATETLLSEDAGQGVIAHAHTIALGQLVLQVFAERTSAGASWDLHHRPGPWAVALRKIWPSSAARMSTPAVALTAEQFAALQDRFVSRHQPIPEPSDGTTAG